MSVTIPQILAKKSRGEALTMLTCYDATFAKLLNQTNIDMLLVGDSLGMVIQGHTSTIPVSVEQIIYHTSCVMRSKPNAHVVADMPFMSYQSSIRDALLNAARLMQEGGAQSVKVEGAEDIVPVVSALNAAGVPVMGHIGMRPQAVHQTGGYKIQGKDIPNSEALLEQARNVETAGAYALVLEGVAIETAQAISKKLTIPTIGICSGPHCDGQVLVIYDLLGMDSKFSPRFLKKYADLSSVITNAISEFVEDVKEKKYPTLEHGTHIEPRQVSKSA